VNANFGFILYLSTFLSRANPDNLSKKPQFDVMVHDLFCSFFIRKKINPACIYVMFCIQSSGCFLDRGADNLFFVFMNNTNNSR